MLQAAIVGLGWWGQHVLRQLRGSNIIDITEAVGSREAHRAFGYDGKLLGAQRRCSHC